MNWWDKLKIIVTSITAIAIPIVSLIIGNMYTEAIKEKELQIKMVEMAVGVLKETNLPPTEEYKSLKNWANEIIDRYSGVPLPKAKINKREKSYGNKENESFSK